MSTVTPPSNARNQDVPGLTDFMDDQQAMSDSMFDFLEREPIAFWQFPSLVTSEQSVPFFSPGSSVAPNEPSYNAPLNSQARSTGQPQEAASFSRFGSRLPSLEPEQQQPQVRSTQSPRPMGRPIQSVSTANKEHLESALAEFACVIPTGVRLPSQLALSRYVGAYISCFHEHLPFLHVPTLSIGNSNAELVLAMASVGTQYCFEGEQGIPLFHAARAVATERIRRRDSQLAKSFLPAATMEHV